MKTNILLNLTDEWIHIIKFIPHNEHNQMFIKILQITETLYISNNNTLHVTTIRSKNIGKSCTHIKCLKNACTPSKKNYLINFKLCMHIKRHEIKLLSESIPCTSNTIMKSILIYVAVVLINVSGVASFQRRCSNHNSVYSVPSLFRCRRALGKSFPFGLQVRVIANLLLYLLKN